jgi:phosphate acetyltransferase
MAGSLYIISTEPESGRSVVVLGIMDFLKRRVHKIGFFKPIISSAVHHDVHLELVLDRYRPDFAYEDMYAFTHEEALQLVNTGRQESLIKDIFKKYKELEKRVDFILCVGTSFTGITSAFDAEFNAIIANNFGCPLLAVLSGREKTQADILESLGFIRETFSKRGCTLFASVVNRTDPDDIDDVKKAVKQSACAEPVYCIPEDALLVRPTIGEIITALGGSLLYGSDSDLNREVTGCKIAAMRLPNYLKHIEEGDLILVPGDRDEIILGSAVAVFSRTYPSISGLVLTGGLLPEPSLKKLLEGLSEIPIPVISAVGDTYSTAVTVNTVRPVITPDNARKIAAALGLFEACIDARELDERLAVTKTTRRTPIMFEYELIDRAKSKRQRIVLPEGTDERILYACDILMRRDVVDIILLGSEQEIYGKASSLGIDLKQISIVDPKASDMTDDYVQTFFELRKHKGITVEIARDIMADVSYFGTMMVYKDHADGMVSGAVHTTQHTIRPSFEIIKTQPGCSIVSSLILMCLKDRVVAYGDCAVNPNPTAEQLADIAVSSAETARMFGIDPLIAMLSYSTGESGKGTDVEAVRQGAAIAKQRRPDLKIEGPIQFDAAVDLGVAKTKLPGSEVAGNATVFIFPDLNTGNNTYKAVQRSSGAVAIGPVLQGLRKPVNDLSRGCTITDIVNTVAITAVQAQAMKG